VSAIDMDINSNLFPRSSSDREKGIMPTFNAWRELGWYQDLTIGEAIAHAASARPDDALVFASSDGGVVRVPLGELHARALGTAGALQARGFTADAHVIVQAPVDARSTELLIALWTIGAVVVPLTATAGADEVAHALRETGATRAVVVPEWRGRDLLGEMRAHGVADVISLTDDLAPAPVRPPERRDASADACVLYTSGSTAAPKGVRHTHETLLVGLAALPTDTTTTTLAAFPAGHVASLIGLLRPLTAGGTTILMDRWSARRAAELIEEYRVNVSAGTPFFLATLLDEAERAGRDISSLQRFLCGAAPVPPALVERAEAAGIVTWRSYGSTEHPAIATSGPDHPPAKRRNTDGMPVPGVELRLVDEAGHDVPAGQEGEIVVRGPKQFVGYQNPDADRTAFLDGGWFRTGDLARLDSDGYLIVTDRVKDIIIRGGENISAREVEEVLLAHPAVQEVAVAAVADPVFGELVGAFVIARDPSAVPTLAELVDHARARGLAPHKLPERLTLVDDFPRTAAGKVRKRELKSPS